MANDDYIIGRLYIPLVMIIILGVMIYFHRKNALKYLYMVNIFCWITAILSYFVLINQPVGEKPASEWMISLPFIWMGGIFGGFFLSPVSVGLFVIEQAQRHMWAKVTVVIAGFAIVLSSMAAVAWVIMGIMSLYSG